MIKYDQHNDDVFSSSDKSFFYVMVHQYKSGTQLLLSAKQSFTVERALLNSTISSMQAGATRATNKQNKKNQEKHVYVCMYVRSNAIWLETVMTMY